MRVEVYTMTGPFKRCEERRLFTARMVKRCFRKTGHDGSHWFKGERIETGDRALVLAAERMQEALG